MATPFNVRLNPLNGSSDRPDAGDVGEEASGLQLWVGSEPLDNMVCLAGDVVGPGSRKRLANLLMQQTSWPEYRHRNAFFLHFAQG